MKTRKTVLVVEDEEALRHLIRVVLVPAGYTVLLAADGEEALELLEGQPRSVDLLLTDLSLPGMDGRELARRVRHRSPATQILIASGDLGRAAQGAEPLHDTRFLGKPFSVTSLREAVKEALGS